MYEIPSYSHKHHCFLGQKVCMQHPPAPSGNPRLAPTPGSMFGKRARFCFQYPVLVHQNVIRWMRSWRSPDTLSRFPGCTRRTMKNWCVMIDIDLCMFWDVEWFMMINLWLMFKHQNNYWSQIWFWMILIFTCHSSQCDWVVCSAVSTNLPAYFLGNAGSTIMWARQLSAKNHDLHPHVKLILATSWKFAILSSHCCKDVFEEARVLDVPTGTLT